MKKYWRCFVCNDIHLGARPPDVCPTCGVRRAYVEITSEEARQIAAPVQTEFTKETFRAAIEAFAEGNPFQVSPDEDKVQMLIEGVFANERNHVLKYCPCRLRTKDFAEDVRIICPCNFIVHETYKDKADGECWCGLFVRRKE